MKTLLIANKHLGALVLEMLLRRGHDVTLITADAENASAIWAERLSVKTTVKPDRVPLVGEDIPAGLDLVISAHCGVRDLFTVMSEELRSDRKTSEGIQNKALTAASSHNGQLC